MEHLNPTHQTPRPVTSPPMEATDELLVADVDEPPEHYAPWSASQLAATFAKANAAITSRRESLLTRQLHSEAEHSTDDDEALHAPPRALSTQSTWSNPSVASTAAELTSDDGHSVASPAISPPLPPTTVRNIIPITDKPLSRELRIIGLEERTAQPNTEQAVEAGLGRKRCISFACGGKDKTPPTSQPVVPAKAEQATAASPPKRKCAIKFVCPVKGVADSKPLDRPSAGGRRMSPLPPERRPHRAETMKTHRGSDSTVTHASPTSVKKTPAIFTTVTTPTTPIADPFSRRRMSNDSLSSTEATRFHEFASSDDEPEEWVQESGCHRSRLTVNDTLEKENILRKACQEVEEEVVEEEGDDEDEEDDLDDDANGEDEEDEDDALEEDDEDDESDDGFRTDDEEGFAESDSEGEDSDEDWWRPGGRSTAATSIDQVDRLALVHKDDTAPASSVGSASSAQISPRGLRIKHHRKRNLHAGSIDARPQPMDLPDSTDFVCGTLDEDRPMEQAYLNQLKQKEASKHKARPQDIDPTFPTSDPEMDDEDDEDLVNPEESGREDLMHGELDDMDDAPQTLRPTTRPRARSNANRSPPPTKRRRSPAPGMLKRQSTARSPPPPTRRGTARSPPPRKLFGHSPKRSRSPAPQRAMPSPPNTRRASPWASADLDIGPGVLAGRPQLTHTASLPRGGFMLGKTDNLFHDATGPDTIDNHAAGEIPKRGAIDIYKGLEKKRQRRKEKLYQKLCAKAAAKGEKAYKVKPGRGAERMREVGLELQRYHGKSGHILSM